MPRHIFAAKYENAATEYAYQLERLEILSAEDWNILSRADKHPKPAMWQPSYDFGPSLFGTEAEALRELRAELKTQGWTIPAN
ncbi:MAG: hypothetical protein IKO68_03775 [Oscillospiraceae bacterium]|nr:hypothetical protein [Oscillospiraceae bacterium]MBR4655695.1 hypothetical protein [Oscillospiraceae bacterium]